MQISVVVAAEGWPVWQLTPGGFGVLVCPRGDTYTPGYCSLCSLTVILRLYLFLKQIAPFSIHQSKMLLFDVSCPFP
jgi:hypothetical protein